MDEFLLLSISALAGIALGVVFFGGLWWTVQKGVIAAQPALWFAGSFLLRTGLVGTGFIMAARGDWRRLVACLGGFALVRVSMLLFTKSPLLAKAGNRWT